VDQQTGGGDAQRNSIAQTLMQQPQQASSGGQVQYSAPGPASVPAGYAPPGDNSDIPAALLGRMSPTDIALFRRAQQGQAIPTGVAGPYGGGAMGQPQIPAAGSFTGAGLPPTNIGQGGLTPPGAGSGFAGGGSPVGGNSGFSTYGAPLGTGIGGGFGNQGYEGGYGGVGFPPGSFGSVGSGTFGDPGQGAGGFGAGAGDVPGLNRAGTGMDWGGFYYGGG
jgi:hypothetical protein